MSRLFIVRHGNTFEHGEASRRIGMRTDLPLTTEGREQARRLGEMFCMEGIAFDRAVTGPLQRTLVTARIILEAMADPTPPFIEAALAEIDYGPDENVPENEVVARHGLASLARWDKYALAPAGWRIDQPARVAWWREMAATCPAGGTLIVTSNGAARFALLALADGALPPVMKLRTGSVGVLRREERRGWSVERWDQRPGDGFASLKSR